MEDRRRRISGVFYWSVCSVSFTVVAPTSLDKHVVAERNETVLCMFNKPFPKWRKLLLA